MSETFLQDLAIVMIVAGLVTVLFHQLRQPVVLGYILAGVIIGPHALHRPLITNEASIHTLSQLGIVLLMLSLGLQFSFRRLWQLGATAFLAASLEILLMVGVGYQVGRFFGWNRIDSLFLGAMLISSSSIIIFKTLSDLGLAKEKFAQFIFGVLFIEDLFAVGAIALLPVMAVTGSLEVRELAITVGKMGVFLSAMVVIGLLLVPYLLRYVVRFGNDEVLLVTVLALAFGVSLVAMRAGYSVALGAFIIGAVMAETRERGRIELLIAPVRDMFSAVFFVAVGMLFQPDMVREHWVAVLVVFLVLIVGKTIGGTSGAFIAGNDLNTSLRVGLGLTPIGEFAFIITQLGLTLKVTSPVLYPIAVSVSAAATLLAPYLIRNSNALVTQLERAAPRGWMDYLGVYTRWVAQIGHTQRSTNQIRQLMRKWVLQIGLNMALITGLFIAAAAVSRRWALWRAEVPHWTGGPNAALWLAAMILALPLLIATMRKFRAVAAVIAELSVARTAARENTPAIRGVVSNTILAFGTAGVGLWVLVLSAAILPPWPVLLVLLLVIAAVTAVMWRSFIQLYAKAQIALLDTLSQPAPPAANHHPHAIQTMLRDAELESLAITSQSPAAGKLIRELALRTRTGASAVGIERNGKSIINPGPDEELLPGDKVLLLGNPTQLDEARKLLVG